MQLSFDFAKGFTIQQFQLAPRRARTFSPTEMRERIERLKRESKLPPLKDVLAVFTKALDANFLRSVGIAPEEE